MHYCRTFEATGWMMLQVIKGKVDFRCLAQKADQKPAADINVN
jgi:tellurite resistance-related uncharacterized protein